MNDDQDLVRRSLRGDQGAFEMIVRRYQQPIVNYVGRMVGERELALDISQDVFLKVYAGLRSYRPQYKFSAWLFKIASNYMIDYWRKKKITARSLDHGFDDGEDGPPIQVAADEPSVARQYEMGELRGRLEAAIAELPPGLRELFVLRHVNELSYEEMAEIKGIPVGTVKNRVFLAKERLKTILEGKT
jgi:RNA polymerase sigma-70 factor, ECF subfamily